MRFSLSKDIGALQEQVKSKFDQQSLHPDIHALKLQEAIQHLAGQASEYLIAEAEIRNLSAEDLAQKIIENHSSKKLNPLLEAELARQVRVAEIRSLTDANELEALALEVPFIS